MNNKVFIARSLGPLLSTWIDFNPSRDKKITPILRYEITYLFSNFNGAAVEVWEWVTNLIPH